MVNTTAAIMAIPAPLENIRLVGDEEKHATLLFFGETSTLPDDAKNTLIESVKTACDMLFPFTERLREIARLGNDVPPALVAKLSDECLSQVRNLFMMNPAVNGYLSNAQQFPSFTPHVTLAYPDYAEEAIIRTLASQLYRVRFDRLAVWWNDERIEFPLSRIFEGDTMAMSDAIGDFLQHYGFAEEADEDDAEHYGVKGMKWGVRKADTGTASSRGPAKRAAQKRAIGDAVRTVNGQLTGVKRSPKFKGKDLNTDPKLKAEYDAEIKRRFKKALVVAAAVGTGVAVSATFGPGFGGVAGSAVGGILKTRTTTTVGDPSIGVFGVPGGQGDGTGGVFGIPGDAASEAFFMHADVKVVESEPVGYYLVFDRDEKGFANSIDVKELAAKHSLDDVDDVLEHFGVKGMKWGIRRQVNPKTGLVARTSSADQIHVDRIAKKLHSGGVSALSNKDLKDFSARIQAEQEFNRARSSQEAQRSKPFIQRFLATQGKRQFTRVTDKAIDIAVEKALEEAGIRVGKKNKDAGALLVETGKRLKPKKK